MEKEVVDEKKEIANNNDANKFEEVETYQEVEPIKKEIRTDSYFDGKTIQLIGINILSTILNFISFGLLSAFTFCYKTKWIIKHTVINRKKLVFTGRAISLFGRCMLWGFLTVITFGIFGLWVPIKKLKWQNKNTHIKVVGEEEYKKDKSLYIAIPVLIIGIILFSLIVPKIISNIGGTGDFNIEEMFENIGNALVGNETSTKRPSLESMNPNTNGSTSVSNKNNTSISTTNNNNTSTSNSKGNTSSSTGSSASSSTNKNSQANFSKFSGTYIDVFGSSPTLTIDKNGKVTISGRVVTNNLSSMKKQGNGSYSCSISGGEIIIYPVGVKSSNGNSNKVRIDVVEYGGALCFQEK